MRGRLGVSGLVSGGEHGDIVQSILGLPRGCRVIRKVLQGLDDALCVDCSMNAGDVAQCGGGSRANASVGVVQEFERAVRYPGAVGIVERQTKDRLCGRVGVGGGQHDFGVIATDRAELPVGADSGIPPRLTTSAMTRAFCTWFAGVINTRHHRPDARSTHFVG